MSNLVEVNWIEGTKFLAQRGMTGFTGNIYVGLHEFVDMMFVLHFLRPGDVFGDVGANVGSYTILASGVAGAKTVAFEPDPNTCVLLQKNIELNQIETRVSLKPLAVGAKAGHVEFTIGRDTMNQVAEAHDGNTQTVEMITLDEAFIGNAPTMLKLDVEGFEDEAISGAEKVLSNNLLKVVALESTTIEITDRLLSAGFKPCFYDFEKRTLSNEMLSQKASNQLFVRDQDFVNERLLNAAKVKIFGDCY